MVAQFPRVAGEEVGDFVLFQVRPKIFHRVELRGVGRQPLEPAPATAAGEQRLDRLAAVNRGPVPDHKERELVPVERLLQHRRAAAGRPRPHAVGARAQSALVDEDDGALFSLGQPCLVQAASAASSRSIARRAAAGGSGPASARSTTRGPRDSAPRSVARLTGRPAAASTSRSDARAPTAAARPAASPPPSHPCRPRSALPLSADGVPSPHDPVAWPSPKRSHVSLFGAY